MEGGSSNSLAYFDLNCDCRSLRILAKMSRVLTNFTSKRTKNGATNTPTWREKRVQSTLLGPQTF